MAVVRGKEKKICSKIYIIPKNKLFSIPSLQIVT